MQIAKLLDSCTGGVSNQEVQDELYKQLSALGLKVKANEYGVANSGGMRTYFAQLACLGLFWLDRKRNMYATTYAGEQLISGNNPAAILRCQLLRMQYPSVYGLGSQVRIHPNLKVKPFVFLVRLLRDERLGCELSCQDMAVPVIYGRTDADYEHCVTKILDLRKNGDLSTVIDSVDDVRTPKRFRENDPEKDLQMGMIDAVEIANTAKNYLLASQLIVPCDDDAKTFSLTRDPAILTEIRPWLEEGEIIEKLDADHQEAWQQRFGRLDKTKAVRSINKKSADGFKTLIQAAFINAVTASPYGIDPRNFVMDEAAKWGKSTSEVAKIVNPLLSRKRTIERETVMLAAASGGREALKLELAVTNLFRQLGFDLSEHIGQKKAPRAGGYPDIRVQASSIASCGFVDTKATMTYSLPIGDTVKLQTYYKECWQEFPDHSKVEFFVYVAGGFGRSDATIKALLKKCAENFGRPVSAVTVSALLDLAEMTGPSSVMQVMNKLKESDLFTAASVLM